MSAPPVFASAVLVAAGSSTRMAAGERKPFLRLAGRTVLEHACAAFDAVEAVRELVLVGRADDLGRLEDLRASAPALAKVTAVVAGGVTRTDSVRLGALATSGEADLICVHDAARALVTPEVVAGAVALAAREGASVVAIPARDTIKRGERTAGGARAVETLERDGLWAAQTPQVFRAVEFRALLERAAREGYTPTDDAALWERWVGPVPIAPGDPSNLKLTTAEDLVVAAALLEARSR
jgi:2-C-methyl-D-erythritol 4-phosphate cytidylyltransferase